MAAQPAHSRGPFRPRPLLHRMRPVRDPHRAPPRASLATIFPQRGRTGAADRGLRQPRAATGQSIVRRLISHGHDPWRAGNVRLRHVHRSSPRRALARPRPLQLRSTFATYAPHREHHHFVACRRVVHVLPGLRHQHATHQQAETRLLVRSTDRRCSDDARECLLQFRFEEIGRRLTVRSPPRLRPLRFRERTRRDAQSHR